MYEGIKKHSYTKYDDFCALVSKQEGKKVQMNIGQIKETVKVVRKLLLPTGVDIYKVIGSTPLEVFNEK